MTSTQAVGKVRRILNAQKAGHAGTLDPLASGILPIALGEATKTVPYAQDRLKTYEFTVTWGEQRDTDDSEGKIIARSDVRPEPGAIKDILDGFTGEIEQIPPRFSAIKIDGERAYDLARAGEDVELKPRTVFIESLELIDASQDEARFVMRCGKGTYVRSLARDMAQMLGTCGYVSALRRTQVGGFTEENAISLEKLEEISNSAASEGGWSSEAESLLPLQTALDDIPALALRADETASLRNGQEIGLVSRSDFERLAQAGINAKETVVTAFAHFNGAPVALVEIEGPYVAPVKVFNI
jgi:tRNA pseudouridine55 synthase